MNEKDYFYTEYDEIISNVKAKRFKILTIEKLSETIIHLNNAIEAERTKRILVEFGSKKVIAEMRHYLNKVYFRDYQISEIGRLFKRIIKLAFSVVKIVSRKNKLKRSILLKKLKRVKFDYLKITKFLKEDEIKEY